MRSKTLLMMVFTAQALAVAASPQPVSPRNSELIAGFEGVWSSQGGTDQTVQILKAMEHGHLQLSGADAASAWSAVCVLRNRRVLNVRDLGTTASESPPDWALVCRGSGIDFNGRSFGMESELRLQQGVLSEKWRALFGERDESATLTYVRAQSPRSPAPR